jgi:hypothetical protein
MTPTLFSQLLTLIAITYICSDPNVHHYVNLLASSVPTRLASARFRITLRFSLWLTRRSFTNDRFGRFLRDRELRSIRSNPEYAEFFPASRPVDDSDSHYPGGERF